MSQQNPLQDLTFKAEIDLSLDDAKATSKRYRALKSGTLAQELTSVTGVADRVIGFQQNLPKLGELIELSVLGTTKVRAGGVIAVWADVKIDAAGKLVTGGAGGDKNVGIALEASAADGDIIEIILLQTPRVT